MREDFMHWKDMLNHMLAASIYTIVWLLMLIPFEAINTMKIESLSQDVYLFFMPAILLFGFKIYTHVWNASYHLSQMFMPQSEKRKNEENHQILCTQEFPALACTSQSVSTGSSGQSLRGNPRVDSDTTDVCSEYQRSPTIDAKISSIHRL